nr:hypothetical protein Iba_chr07cCG7430 [Ipomoea batatas]
MDETVVAKNDGDIRSTTVALIFSSTVTSRAPTHGRSWGRWVFLGLSIGGCRGSGELRSCVKPSREMGSSWKRVIGSGTFTGTCCLLETLGLGQYGVASLDGDANCRHGGGMKG